MMHPRAALRDGGARRTRDRDNGCLFGVGAGNPIEGAQLTGAENRRERCHAVEASVAVSGVGRVQFVAGANPLETLGALDMIQEAEVVIPGDAKEVPDAEFLQTREQVVADCRG